ncbi:MAG: pyridoxamine 5'-phosphate oxidase [Alphaproteobacteria bacterium]|nr:pyridoxamine 5'-phosphate oxidase [Alphaproteobacteria bacterium]MBU2042507.1 pyridoxamine 5'-phosphate oxidase [Alphaproteobacteria bacterium]MBU2126697.1 pyridoxamine 5'-phosphate oxidase [Alphaproteobacteria bacterium]MBU2208188.1 pyridoxamine 5'-phosphate oxidase [Alphaproteobacteria bacterium]MBU2290536.1 pyridoxamine 5'-phosphate oxidase [Alphaproteobacteria bacterium]
MTAPVIPPSPTREQYAEEYAAALAANGDETIFGRPEPIGLFVDWLGDAKATEPNDANAMALSTVDAAGAPDSRMVLLKDVDARGFTFYSNRESAKGLDLDVRPRAALLFHWKSLRRQVRVRGAVEPVTAAEADAYFASRARESRIGAWASDQSRPLDSRAELEAAVARESARFEGVDVPRPDRWTGWRLVPDSVEFWRDRPFRLHDRLRFDRDGDAWTRTRLWP